MGRDRSKLIFVCMLGLAAAVRLNNVFTFPSLRAFDGYGHFVYIWFMADQWRVPLATSGWSFFHPPLYYAFMASVWTLLAPLDAVTRLSLGTAMIAMLGLIHGIAAWIITRRYFPGRPTVHLLAAGLMFFLPVHLYSSSFLGNEGLNSALCSASLLALVWVLRLPRPRRGAVLGFLLGAALLTKFTSVAIVTGAFATLALQTAVRRNWRTGTATLIATASVMLSVCGWYYARNVSVYGTPFKLSRDEFMVRHVENYQSQGRRNLWEYVLFDPVILYRPQWPRGIPLTGDFSEHAEHSVLRESVPTGVYANAWFDGGTGNVLPPVTVNNASRRAGQLVLTLALAPSLLVVVGVVTAIRRLWRAGWDDTLVAMLLTFGTMVALFVQATKTVPMHAAVKATYLTPVSLTFAFWFALGADALRSADARWFRRVTVVCGLLAATCVAVFTHDLLIARNWLVLTASNAAAWQNLYGIVYYAAGDHARALELFRSAGQENWYLAEENLAYLLRQEGHPLEALYHVRNAAQCQLRQSFGTRQDRAQFDRMSQADYQNQMAIVYYQMGWLDAALAAADKAYELDGTVPEIGYNLAVLKMAHVLSRPTRDRSFASVELQSRRLLFGAASIDPAFHDVAAMAGVLDALDDACERAIPIIESALAPHPGEYRAYPVTTGPGNVHAAGLGRRARITDLPEPLRPEYQLARCRAQIAAR